MVPYAAGKSIYLTELRYIYDSIVPGNSKGKVKDKKLKVKKLKFLDTLYKGCLADMKSLSAIKCIAFKAACR